MKRIDKIRIEIQGIARDRGHNPSHVTYAGRSLKERGERVCVTCVDCSMTAQGLTKPAPNQIDIAGELIALNCNVATTSDWERDTTGNFVFPGSYGYSARACANLIP